VKMNWQKAKIIRVDMCPVQYIIFTLEVEGFGQMACAYTKQTRIQNDLLRMVCCVPEYFENRFKGLEGTLVDVVLVERESADCFPSRWTEVSRIRAVELPEAPPL